jgi:hypothetical protein
MRYLERPFSNANQSENLKIPGIRNRAFSQLLVWFDESSRVREHQGAGSEKRTNDYVSATGILSVESMLATRIGSEWSE